MRTKGMVYRVAILLSLTSYSFADNASVLVTKNTLNESSSESEGVPFVRAAPASFEFNSAAPMVPIEPPPPPAAIGSMGTIYGSSYGSPCALAKKSYIFGGTEFMMMHVTAKSGGQVNLSFDDSTTVGTDASFRDGNGYSGYAVAPRFWLGYQICEKWAVVGRYWRFSEFSAGSPNLSPNQTVNLPNFATVTNTDLVGASAIDVEAIRSWKPGQWKVDTMIGARHASVNAESGINAFGVFTTGNFVNMALSNGFDFDGTGVTYGMSVRRHLGDSRAHLFFTGRGSNLSGHTDSFGRAVGSVASSPSAPLVGAATVSRNNANATASIVEMQAGIQWDIALKVRPANAFFRTAFEAQSWDINGLPTGGAGFGGTIGNLTTNSFSSAGLGALKLYGMSIGTGFTW